MKQTYTVTRVAGKGSIGDRFERARAAGEHRAAVEPDLRPVPGRRRASAATARSSPGRATTRSSSTSGRSSTSAACGRSTPLHVIPLADEAGKDGVRNYNTHTIAIQVPKTDLLRAPMADGNIGIYANATRPKIRILRGDGTFDANGPQVQVSRLGNPLDQRGRHPASGRRTTGTRPTRARTASSRTGTRAPSLRPRELPLPGARQRSDQRPRRSRRRAADGRADAEPHRHDEGRPAAPEHELHGAAGRHGQPSRAPRR